MAATITKLTETWQAEQKARYGCFTPARICPAARTPSCSSIPARSTRPSPNAPTARSWAVAATTPWRWAPPTTSGAGSSCPGTTRCDSRPSTPASPRNSRAPAHRAGRRRGGALARPRHRRRHACDSAPRDPARCGTQPDAAARLCSTTARAALAPSGR
jgi:hypothetical protein